MLHYRTAQTIDGSPAEKGPDDQRPFDVSVRAASAAMTLIHDIMRDVPEVEKLGAWSMALQVLRHGIHFELDALHQHAHRRGLPPDSVAELRAAAPLFNRR